MASPTHCYVLKVLLVGDAAVGKSCLVSRFTDNVFDDSATGQGGSYVSTVGMDFRTKTFKARPERPSSSSEGMQYAPPPATLKDEKDKWVRLQLWDTAGQEKFRAITSTYYRGAHGALLVYSITDRRSFEHVDAWLEDFQSFAEDGTPVVLVGNKCDGGGAAGGQDRSVMEWEGQQLAEKHGILFFETSAKTGRAVDEAFERITARMLWVQMHKAVVPESSRDNDGGGTGRDRGKEALLGSDGQSFGVADFTDALIPRRRRLFFCCC